MPVVALGLLLAFLVAGGSSASPSGQDRANGSLNVTASLLLRSSAVPGCTPPPHADFCGVRTFNGTVPGLGKVTGAYSYLLKLGSPSCSATFWRALAYPIHITAPSKGEIELAVAEAVTCADDNAARIQTQTFTIAGGTGIFAGASGSGTLERVLGEEQCDSSSCYRNGFEKWTGTITVPGHEFDQTAPTFSGATSKTVKAKRGTKSARVTYAVTANDDRDGAVPAACAPKSGRRFPIGRTTVKCQATDGSANTGNARFTVTVKRTR
jgi:hypothetical protein